MRLPAPTSTACCCQCATTAGAASLQKAEMKAMQAAAQRLCWLAAPSSKQMAQIHCSAQWAAHTAAHAGPTRPEGLCVLQVVQQTARGGHQHSHALHAKGVRRGTASVSPNRRTQVTWR